MNPKVSMVLRLLLGVFLLVFGLNKFFHFIPVPPIPGDGGRLMEIFVTSGFMTVIAVLEIVVGIALLANKFVPIALTLAIAMMFNAALIHLLFDPENIVGAMIGLVLGIVLVFAYRERFGSFLHA